MTKNSWLALGFVALVVVLVLLLPAVGWYSRIQDEGSNLTKRRTVNFIGSSISCADNAGQLRTDCTLTGGSSSGYDTIWNQGTPVASAASSTVLDCQGTLITCSQFGTTSTRLTITNPTPQPTPTVVYGFDLFRALTPAPCLTTGLCTSINITNPAAIFDCNPSGLIAGRANCNALVTAVPTATPQPTPTIYPTPTLVPTATPIPAVNTATPIPTPTPGRFDEFPLAVITANHTTTTNGFETIDSNGSAPNLGFTLAGGSDYYFRFTIGFTTSATANGVAFSIDGPAAASMIYRVSLQTTANGTQGTDVFSDRVEVNELTGAATTSLPQTTQMIAIIEGHIWKSGGLTGTLNAAVKSENASPSSISVTNSGTSGWLIRTV